MNASSYVFPGYTVKYAREVVAVDDTVTPPIFYDPLCVPDGTHCVMSDVTLSQQEEGLVKEAAAEEEVTAGPNPNNPAEPAERPAERAAAVYRHYY